MNNVRQKNNYGYTSERMTRSGGSHFVRRNGLVGNENKSFATIYRTNADNLRQGHNYDRYHSEINIYNPGRHSDRGSIPYSSQIKPRDRVRQKFWAVSEYIK